jgi:predicted nuclease of predicted toxin-antitoxin system
MIITKEQNMDLYLLAGESLEALGINLKKVSTMQLAGIVLKLKRAISEELEYGEMQTR